MNSDAVIREQLVNMLMERQAHMIFEDSIANFPMAHINTKPPTLEYSFWHLLDHIRFCQWDILDYIRNPNYQSHEFPAGYWQPRDAVTDEAGWQKTIAEFKADLQALVDIVKDPATDLYTPLAHGTNGHNILREILVVADHNAYHLGELGILRHSLKLW